MLLSGSIGPYFRFNNSNSKLRTMLGCESIDGRLISLGEAVRAEVLYELDMDVNVNEFFRLKMEKEFVQQEFLNFNLYKYKL
jgi:hypothetical protein